MRRLWIGLTTAACLISLSTAAASAAVRKASGSSAERFTTDCKKVSYTADGGYYSGGQFFWQPNDEVTLITTWCSSKGVITSDSVHYSTTIPSSLNPRLSTNKSLIKGGTVLNVQVYGDYTAGVINNVGDIGIAGDVTGRGGHHFVNTANAGG